MNCPRCKSPLSTHQASRLAMQCCNACGGLFLDGNASRKVVEAVDPNALAAADQASQRATSGVDLQATIACPVCNAPLNRMPIAAASVTVDACADHGVWFDRDELQKVVHAVAPQRTTPVPMAPAQQPQQQQAAPPSAQPQTMPSGVPYVMGEPLPPTQTAAAQPLAPQAAAPPAGGPPLAPGMLPGQYVAPGWSADQGSGGGLFGLGGGQQQPGQPGQPPQGGLGGMSAGKTALAVAGGVAAVAGVAYVATQTDFGRNLVNQVAGGPPQPGPGQGYGQQGWQQQQPYGQGQGSDFGGIGEVFSKLF